MSNSITQDLKYKQSVIKYSYKNGVTKAAIKFKMHRKTIYRWRERYDGTIESLKDKLRRPHSHPKEHTAEEIRLKEYMIKSFTMDDEIFKRNDEGNYWKENLILYI